MNPLDADPSRPAPDPDASPRVDAGGRRLCSAHTRSGALCRQPAIRGATVCKMHGGSVKRVKAKAAERVALAAIETELTRLRVDYSRRNPGEVLLEQMGRSAAIAAIHELAGNTDDALKAGDTAARQAKLALDAGIDERKVRLAEAQGVELVRMLHGARQAVVEALDAAGMHDAARIAHQAFATGVRSTVTAITDGG